MFLHQIINAKTRNGMIRKSSFFIFIQFVPLVYMWGGTIEAVGADFALGQSDGGDEILYLGVFE
jgi:hypothetical protein